MSNPARHRYAVQTRNGPSELFSTLQVKGGDVQVFVKPSTNLELIASSDPIHHEKYSLHQSPNSTGTLITHTVLSKSGEILMKSPTFIKDSKDFLCWNFRSYACPDPANERYRLDAKKKDTVIYLDSSFITNYLTFCYFLIVQKADGNFPEVEGFNLVTQFFEKFSIGAYSTYLNIPNSAIGSFAAVATSIPTIYGRTVIDENIVARGGVQSDEVENIRESLMQSCIRLEFFHRLRFVLKFPDHSESKSIDSRTEFSIKPSPESEVEIMIPILSNATGNLLVM